MGGQANNFDELVPLVDLCRAGKLFEVQAWIAESKPVNSLTKMIAEYTVEFICLMARFKAARKDDLEELLRTPTIKALVGKYRNRIDEQLESLANDDSVTH
jgi:hypothetical protein